MFQKDETPEDLPLVDGEVRRSRRTERGVPPDGMVQVKLDKLLARTGLATSVTDGLRKVKQNAVKVDGELKTELVASVKARHRVHAARGQEDGEGFGEPVTPPTS